MPPEHATPLALAIRRHTRAVLVTDELVAAKRYVIDGATGKLTLPLTRAELEAESLTLLVPEESPDAVQILAQPRELDERTSPACDRWLAYHLRPDAPRFASLDIESVKRRTDILDGEDLDLRNALREVEPKLCTMLNARKRDVAALCERTLSVRPEETTVVGVDQDGLDVRGRFGVLRIELDEPLRTDDALDRLTKLLDEDSP